jgi:hypothetical protein
MRKPDQIKKHLRALLRRAKDLASTEAEAALAMRRVHALLAEHRLSLHDLGESDERIEDDSYRTQTAPWARCVLDACARYFFCGYMVAEYDERSSGERIPHQNMDKHVFFGERHNVVSAKAMSEYLLQTIDRLANEASAKLPIAERIAYKRSYRAACSVRIANRLVEMMRASSAAALTFEGTTLPALIGEYDKAQSDFQQHVQRYKSRNALTVESGGAAGHKAGTRDGRRAGNAVSLARQVDHGVAAKKLGAQP